MSAGPVFTITAAVQNRDRDFWEKLVKVYLVDLPSLCRNAFLCLLLQNLLSLLHVLVRAGSQRVVEFVVALVHHVPVSVCLLWTSLKRLRIQTMDYDHSLKGNGIRGAHRPSGLLPTAPSRLRYRNWCRPRRPPFYLRHTAVQLNTPSNPSLNLPSLTHLFIYTTYYLFRNIKCKYK